MKDLNKDFDEVYRLCKIHGLKWEIYKEKNWFDDYVFKVSKMLTRNGYTDKSLKLSKIRYSSDSLWTIYNDLCKLILRGAFLDETQDMIYYRDVYFDTDAKEQHFYPHYFYENQKLDPFKFLKVWGATYEIDDKLVHITKKDYKKTVLVDVETELVWNLHNVVSKDILDGLLY